MICTSIFAPRGHDMEVLVFWMWIETGENVIPSRRFWHNKYRSRGHKRTRELLHNLPLVFL